MKINKIYIQNFKGISEKTVEFKDGYVSALLGPNGLGKSSFIEALRYGLTGATPQNPIRDDAESALVGIELDDGTTFSRTVFAGDKPSKVTVNRKVTPAKNLNTWIAENYGFGTDVLKVATSAEVLASMKSDELGDFLLQYVPEKLNTAKILGFISEVTEDMQEIVSLAFPEENFDIDAVSKVYEGFMETRKKAKKDFEYLNSKFATLPTDKPLRNYTEVQKAFEELCKKEGAAKTLANAKKIYESNVAKRETALKNLATLQEKFESISASRPNPLMRKGIETKIAEARKILSDAQSAIKTMQNSITVFAKTVERLATNHCPLSDSLVCTTDKTKVRDEILTVIKSNEDSIRVQQELISKKEGEISSLNLSLKKYDENAFAYKEKIIIGEQIEKLKKSIPDIPEKPKEISLSANFEKEKSALKAEMEYAKKWEEKEKLEKELEKGAQTIVTYDHLCKAFAPKGEVMTKILSSYLSIFEEEINKKAKMMRKEMEVKFFPENGIKYFVKTKDKKEFHLYEELSKGEKTLAAFLLLDLVSSLCGTRMMIIDDLNNLDSTALNEIFELVTTPEFQDCYDHIIIASVDSSDVMNVVKKHDAVIQKI